MDWLSSPFFLVPIGYLAALAAFFAIKLNRDEVVATEHGTGEHVEAIEFFWRPG